MSVRYGLLALLSEAPGYGYQLRSDFEARTGGTWSVNIGQIYTTLTRLERDGLVQADGSDDEGRQRYSITSAGEDDLQTWFAEPIKNDSRPKDALAVKLALAMAAPGTDIGTIVQAQRADTMRELQSQTRAKARLADDDIAASLLLDSVIFQLEAELRWLDHIEGRLTDARPQNRIPEHRNQRKQ